MPKKEKNFVTEAVSNMKPRHCETKPGRIETSHHSLSHELRVSELASEQMNVRSGACEQSEQGRASEFVSGASEQANRRVSELIHGCAGPSCVTVHYGR